MKPISKTLLSFIKTNFFKTAKIPTPRFSTLSKKFIHSLFELMFEGHRLLSSIELSVQHIKSQESIPKSYDYNYIPSNIRSEIDRMDKNAYVYRFSLQSKEYQVVFIYPVDSIYSENLFIKRIHKVIMWLYVANNFASNKCSQKMNIFMYFTGLEKTLPISKKTISQEHANTAFTTSCKTTTEINLFREEEWFKVFIHETFHNLGLDFSGMNENLSRQQILSIFPVESQVNLFETYCEMWAEIMNVVFIVFFSSKDRENLGKIPSFITKTEEHLHYEQVFSLFQCIKVLHFFGLDYRELYEDSRKNEVARDLKFKEKRTNVLAYYILKSIYMFYLNDFIEWCIQHNRSSLDFKKDEQTIHSYCNFIRSHHKEKGLLHSIDIMEDWFRTNNIYGIECTTMRMTLFEDD
jgi:hypothetical protein